MNKTEREDFNAILKRYNYTESVFRIKETDTTVWNPNELSPITGTILITLDKTNKSKNYRTGMGSKWLIELENDLKKDAFS